MLSLDLCGLTEVHSVHCIYIIHGYVPESSSRSVDSGHWTLDIRSSGEFLLLNESLRWISDEKSGELILKKLIKIRNSMKSRPILRLKDFEPHAIVEIRIVLLIDQ